MSHNTTPWSTCPLDTGEFTIDDLEVILGRGMHYEILDGVLLVSKGPRQLQQIAMVELAHLLRANCSPDCRVLLTPMSFQPSSRVSLEPDVMVARQPNHDDQSADQMPAVEVVLVVEVVSSASRIIDQTIKRAIYEQAGVTGYWLFDPELEELTVLELVDGIYLERATVKGDEVFEATVPFVVQVVPRVLVG